MSTTSYMLGRKKYQRPQAMLWADNPGSLVDGSYIPNGFEIGADETGLDPATALTNEFIILSDDNRKELNFTPTRIENRQRTINGRMRSYHIADKLTIGTSWSMLPSRAYHQRPEFDTTTGKSSDFGNRSLEYTTDGGAGGVEILDWYENHKGSFWVYLSYDKYSNFGKDDAAYEQLKKYNQIVEVFISDFSYTVSKRGGSNFDFWDISVTLEEV